MELISHKSIDATHEFKEDTVVNTHSILTSPSSDDESQVAVWKTGWKTRFPWLGAVAILGVWVSAGAAAIVLVLANRKPQSSWPKRITPNVILAAINSFSDIMLAIAIGQGVAIAWWRKALHGSTVKDLHHSWGFSTSLLAFLQGWKYLNFIALAALAAKVAIINGILLQRATETYQANEPSRNISIIAPHLTNFPITGTIPQDGSTATITDNYFQTRAVGPWNGGQLDAFSTTSGFKGCNGVCEGTLPSIGFSYSCDTVGNSFFRYSNVQPLNLTDLARENTSIPVFDVSFATSWANATKSYTSIIFDALYYTAAGVDGDCSGNVGHMRCEMRPAVLKSDFTILNYDALSSAAQVESKASLQLGWFLHSKTMGKTIGDSSSMSQAIAAWNKEGDQLNMFEVESFLPIAEDGSPGNSTMGGFQLALQEYLGASANISYNAASKTWDLQSKGTFANKMLGAYTGYVPETCNYGSSQGTGLSIINAINNLAMTLSTSQEYSSPSYNLTILQTNLGVHYKTSYPFMAAAICFMVLCTLLILPSYWGYWELGRQLSLAPVEIASAFIAPVLEHPVAGKVIIDDLINEVGDRKIMFGQLEGEKRLGVLAFEKVKRVETNVW